MLANTSQLPIERNLGIQIKVNLHLHRFGVTRDEKWSDGDRQPETLTHFLWVIPLTDFLSSVWENKKWSELCHFHPPPPLLLTITFIIMKNMSQWSKVHVHTTVNIIFNGYQTSLTWSDSYGIVPDIELLYHGYMIIMLWYVLCRN